MTPEAGRAVADAIQVINLILALAILVIAIDAGRRWRAARPYLAGPVSFAVHSLVFYVAALADVVVAPWSSLWSAALRLHGYLFLLGTLLAFYVVALAPAMEPEPDEGDDDGQ